MLRTRSSKRIVSFGFNLENFPIWNPRAYRIGYQLFLPCYRGYRGSRARIDYQSSNYWQFSRERFRWSAKKDGDDRGQGLTNRRKDVEMYRWGGEGLEESGGGEGLSLARNPLLLGRLIDIDVTFLSEITWSILMRPTFNGKVAIKGGPATR